jgi:cbb3-type cytochrome c oxidase subunit III
MILATVAILRFALPGPSAASINGKAVSGAAAGQVDAAALFGEKCSICHGKDGRGLPDWRAKGQPNFTDDNWQGSRVDRQLTESITNGKGRYMPAWKTKLSQEQINALVARVRAFGKR